MKKESKIFLDTAFAIALSSVKDLNHQKALHIAEELEASKVKLVTTRAVIFEILNFLAKKSHRELAVQLVDSIESDVNVEIVELTENLCQNSYELYRSRPDKEWGLTDCFSFVVMREKQIHIALTTDAHFTQAGFEALLRK